MAIRYMNKCLINITNHQVNGNHNCQNGYYKKKKKKGKCWWGCEEKRPLCTLTGNVSWWSHYEKSTEFPQIIKNRTAIWSCRSISGLYPKEMKALPWRDFSTPKFIAALFTIARTCKQTTCVPEIWVDEEYVVCT